MTRPNVIVIMVDDMGFSDLGCYGSEIETPNLDRLANNGVRLTRFHNTARCCPSRACVLTGLYPHQTGVGYMMGGGEGIAYQGSMRRPHVTLGEVFSKQGYDTIMSGKWHVGGGEKEAKAEGFNHVNSFIAGGCRSYFPLDKNDNFEYITDWIADGVIEGIKNSKGPFMVYWTPTAPHYPLHAKEKDVAKYRGEYSEGPIAIAKRRYARMKELGIAEEGDWDVPDALIQDQRMRENKPRKYKPHRVGYRLDIDTDMPHHKVGGKQKHFKNTRWTETPEEGMEVYAAMIDALDQSVGRVVEYLEQENKLDNTLIMFCSDNGCSAENLSVGKVWAEVADTPFLKWKRSAYEGGNCSPFIMHWPARTPPEQRGTINRTSGHLIDIISTAMDAAGASYIAKDRHGNEVPPCEGHSLLGILKGDFVPLPNPIFIEHDGNRGVITDNWKLTADGTEPWHLFDLRVDRFERNDVAEENPEKVKELEALWNEWAFKVDAREDGGRPHKKKSQYEMYKKRVGE